MGQVSKHWLAHPYQIYPQVTPAPPTHETSTLSILLNYDISRPIDIYTEYVDMKLTNISVVLKSFGAPNVE